MVVSHERMKSTFWNMRKMEKWGWWTEYNLI